jgi:hypothetical protein
MADQIDEANELNEAAVDRSVERARAQAALMLAGVPGDCDLCGEPSGRLVRGACAPCRDRRGLP